MDIVRDDIMQSLENIENITIESEMNVIQAMADSYQKSLAILENYNGDDVDSFSIFQEAAAQESDGESTFRKTDKNGKKENIIISILKFIPRLCMLIIRKMKSFIQSKKKIQMRKQCTDIRNKYTPELIEYADQMFATAVQNDPNETTSENVKASFPEYDHIIKKSQPYIDKFKAAGKNALEHTKAFTKNKDNMMIAGGAAEAASGTVIFFAKMNIPGFVQGIIAGSLFVHGMGNVLKGIIYKNKHSPKNTMISIGMMKFQLNCLKKDLNDVNKLNNIFDRVPDIVTANDINNLFYAMDDVFESDRNNTDAEIKKSTDEMLATEKLIDHIEDVCNIIFECDDVADKLLAACDKLEKSASRLIQACGNITFDFSIGKSFNLKCLTELTDSSRYVIENVNDCINIATTAFEALDYTCEQITEISDKWKKKAQ